MLAALVNAYGDYDNLQQKAASVPRGRAGLAYGNPANVLDAAKIISECWNELPAKSIKGCWRRANCLPSELYCSEERQLNDTVIKSYFFNMTSYLNDAFANR